MSLTNPQNLDEMCMYVMTRLGHPVNNIEIHKNQLDIAIADAVQYFQTYNYGDGAKLVNTTLLVAKGVSEYSVEDSNIEAAYDISLSYGMGGINTLFSPMNMLLYDEWVTKGNTPWGGSGSYNFGGAGILTTYEVAGEYMKNLSNMFGKDYTVRYDRAEKKLIITPAPDQCMVATLKLYTKSDASKMYNFVNVKGLAVANAMVQWGRNIGAKYNVTLPDGTTFNGGGLMDRGYTEVEKYETLIRSESEPCMGFIG